MPNNVKNIVKMKNLMKLPLFTGDGDIKCFDFNKLIPMPESLDMDSPESLAIEAVMRKLSEHRFSGTNYKQMSDADYIKRTRCLDLDEQKLLKDGLQYITNKVLYGATHWYDWRIDNWGTKWNAYDNKMIGDDTIKFETAWSAPEPVMLKLSESYPGIRIEHWWADEDLGNNCGHRVYHGGKIVEGDYHDDCSNAAYETFIKCWGESPCLYQDSDGLWQRRDCETCHNCY